jgi:NAD(P)-dependent dehydrogenase (short-subunit alcohol dehydrogenase family)
MDGKTALVTGSSQGIGLGVARAFARHGAKVVLTSERAFDACPELAADIDSSRMSYIQADLLDDEAVRRLAEEADARLGGIDILVNNAGTWREPDFLALTRADFDFILHLNVWSALALTREVVKRSVARGRGGRILFTTSLNGSRSEPAHTLYDASKGALNAITRQLAIELAPRGFITAAVATGMVETPLTDYGLRSDPDVRQPSSIRFPSGGWRPWTTSRAGTSSSRPTRPATRQARSSPSTADWTRNRWGFGRLAHERPTST